MTTYERHILTLGVLAGLGGTLATAQTVAEPAANDSQAQLIADEPVQPVAEPAAEVGEAQFYVPELSQWIQELSSDDYQVQFDAREKLQVLFADATRPGADTNYYDNLQIQLMAELSTVTDPSAQRWIVQLIEWFGGDYAAVELSSKLADEDEEVRDAVFRALAATRSEYAVKSLLESLEAAPDEDKAAIIHALAYSEDPGAVYALASFLESDDPAVVAAAAAAQARIRFPMALDAMAAARRRAPASLKPAVESAMLSIGVESQELEGMVRYGSTPSIRYAAYSQLVDRDQQAALAQLTEKVAADDGAGLKEMLHIALQSREQVMITNVVAMLPDLGAANQQVVLTAIADEALNQHESDVLALLPEVTGKVRDAAFHALGVIGRRASIEPLIEAYRESPDSAVVQALARLQARSLDDRLIGDARTSTNVAERLAAVQLLALRNPAGTVDLFNQLAVSESDGALLKAVYKGLESVGRVESCKVLASVVTEQGALKREAQQSLKKLTHHLGIPDVLWDSVYQPAFESAPDVAAGEDLLAILDGVAGPKALAYLETLVLDPGHSLHGGAVRSLGRWPDSSASSVWLKVLAREGASAEELKVAQDGLIRILEKVIPSRHRQEKYTLAVEAIQAAPTLAVKQAILEHCTMPSDRSKAHFERAFRQLLDDPDVGPQVSVLLGKTPPPVEAPAPPPARSVEPGFTSLFDGESLEGWTARGGKAVYTVRDGVIVGTSVLKTPNSFLSTDKLYGDFELKFEVKCGPINSGVQIRSQENEKGEVHGPQVEIEHSPGQAGYVYGEGMGTGWLSPEPKSKDKAVKKHNRLKNDDWNEYRVLAQGARIQTFINGEQVADLTHEETFTSHPKGFIGLQVHSHKVADVEIEWRNIRIKELDPPAGTWASLLDEELSAWEIWTGSPHESVQNLPEGTAVSDDGKSGDPVGLGDPMGLYSVSKDADGTLVMRISGEVYGGITTRESFSNYHLTMQFKWGEKKWEPRLDEKRDSGLLYHCYGEHGAFWNVWKRCLEFQIMEGDFGDLYCIGGTASSVSVNDAGAWEPQSGTTAKRGTRSVDLERPHGEWTRLDLYVLGDTAVHVVEGQVVLALRDAKTHDGQKLAAGQIQIQSEAATCFARDIRIRPIARFPEEIRIAAGFE